MVREIPLTQGKIALVDDDDAERIMRHKWCAVKNGKHWYGKRCISVGDRVFNCYLHRFILGVPDGVPIDHRNGDGLDCQKANMRVASAQENQWNSRISSANTIGFTGVVRSQGGGFGCQFRHDGKAVVLHGFKTPEEAALVYDAFVRRFRGEFARPNRTESDPSAEAVVDEWLSGERQRRGKRSRARLTAEQVAQIKRRLADKRPGQIVALYQVLATEHGVCIAAINHIATGRTWKEIEAAA